MKSVALCASGRYKDELHKFANELRVLGVTVYEPPLYQRDSWEGMTDLEHRTLAKGFTLDHFRKIRLSEVVYVLNPDGYVGNSVRMEIAAAVILGRPIYAYSRDSAEICSDVFIEQLICTPAELVKLLER